MIKVGVVGLGYWGPNLARNLHKLPNADFVCGCDLDQSKFQKLATQYPEASFTSDYDQLLERVDAVAIATPVHTHHALAMKALKHNKHIFIEKPMASNRRECEEIISMAEKRRLTVAVDHIFLFYPPVIKIKELITQGELGDVYFYNSQRKNLGLLQEDVNVIWDLAVHDIYIANWLFDQTPIAVSAVGQKYVEKQEEDASVYLEYPSGASASIGVSWLSPTKIRDTIVVGNKKMVLFDDLERDEKVRVYDKSVNVPEITPFNPLYRSGDISIPKLDNTEALLSSTSDFTKSLEENRQSQVTGEDGLAVVKVLEATDTALKEGRRIEI